MTGLARTTGSNPLAEILDWLDPTQRFGRTGMAPYIPIEDFTREGAYVLRADLPGVDPEKDIEVSVDGDVLTISGQRREEEHEQGHSEVRYGSFSRRIRLPGGAKPEDVTARYDAGVLEVSVPVGDTAAAPIKIPVEREEA